MHYVNPHVKSMFRTPILEGRSQYIRLDQNENPDGVPQWLFEKIMERITPEYLSMYPEDGRLTRMYAQLLGLSPSNVTLTDGSVVGMQYLIKVFGEPGKNLVCVSPTFGMYKVYADMYQMNTIFVRYDEDHTFNVQKLLERIDSDTGIVSLVNPSMPIGNVYNDDEIRAVVEKAQQNNAVVIIDEAYHYFYDKHSLKLLQEYDNVLILRTFSKMLSITGLRLGAIISSAENVQYVNNYKPHYTVNSVALAAGEVIVENFDRVIDELTGTFNEGRDYLLKRLVDAHYTYLPTHGCFICIVPRYRSAEYITERLKQDHNILIFCGKGDSQGFLRVTIWGKKYLELFMDALLKIDVPEDR